MPQLTESQFADLVIKFQSSRRRVWAVERKRYKSSKNLTEAIDAALGLREGDRIQSHQRRVGRRVLKKAQSRLQKVRSDIAKATQFDELLHVIETVTADVSRFGELAVYDVAFRIGIYRGLTPDLVYIHAGTREGARALQVFGRKVERNKFCKPLQKLKPCQIEDFLCVNKDVLKGRSSFKSACENILKVCDQYADGISC